MGDRRRLCSLHLLVLEITCVLRLLWERMRRHFEHGEGRSETDELTLSTTHDDDSSPLRNDRFSRATPHKDTKYPKRQGVHPFKFPSKVDMERGDSSNREVQDRVEESFGSIRFRL